MDELKEHIWGRLEQAFDRRGLRIFLEMGNEKIRMKISFCVLKLALAIGIVLCGGCMSSQERLFQRAELLLSQGQAGLAAMEYYRLAVKYPRSRFAPNALYKLAYLYREEFDNPQDALATYRFLAERYPDSPYADEAWLWILQIQGEKLHDLKEMRRTRDLIRERFAQDERICATAQLQFVRALWAAGNLAAAEAEARALVANYPQQKKQCAAAMLIIARIIEKKAGKQTDAAVKAYEQIINKYPDTAAAVEAKRAIGWLYYGLKGQQEKAELLAKQRAARVLSGVPAPPVVATARLAPFAALSSLLAARRINASPEELLIVSGAAFAFYFEPDNLAAPWRHLPAKALIEAAEQYGFSVNVSSVPAAEAAFSSLAGVIAAGQPVMIPLAGSFRWGIVVGYKPAEERVYLLEAGQRAARAIGRQDFLQRWARHPAGHTPCVTGPYFQLSLGTYVQPASPKTIFAQLGQKAANQRLQIMQGYERLIDFLARHIADAPEAQRQQLRQWAQTSLTELLAERMALARFCHDRAPSGAFTSNLEQAGQAYEQAVRLGKELQRVIMSLTQPVRGAEPPAEFTWPEAVDLARQMKEAEDRALQQIAALAP